MRIKHWSVSVERSGENVVTLESGCMSGRDLQPGDEEAIRIAAHCLLGFIGDPHPAPADRPQPAQERSKDLLWQAFEAGHFSWPNLEAPNRRAIFEKWLASLAPADPPREEPSVQPNPCPVCGTFLWGDTRPCWHCASIAAGYTPPVPTTDAGGGEAIKRLFDELRPLMDSASMAARSTLRDLENRVADMCRAEPSPTREAWRAIETARMHGKPFLVSFAPQNGEPAMVEMVACWKEYEEILGYGNLPALGWQPVPDPIDPPAPPVTERAEK